MSKSSFNFIGGKQLTNIGASWFVSYMYYQKADKTRSNWKNVSDPMYRVAKCNNHSIYHKDWIREIEGMNPNRLGTNKLGLTGADIISMAKILLPKIQAY